MPKVYYQNPLTRLVFRKNWWHRVKGRLNLYRRLLTKDVFVDLEFLLRGSEVKTVFDVGANIGFVTFQFQQAFPEANIYAFEPNPTVFETLAHANSDQKRTAVFNIGIGDVIGQLSFNVNANSGTSSFLKPSAYHLGRLARGLLDPIEVPIITIDDFAEANKLKHIDVLKLDIEGYELKALQGARRLLDQYAIDIVVTEVSIVPQYIGQPVFCELTSYLAEIGYYLFNFDAFVGQETMIRQATIGNAIYISEKYRGVLEERYGVENCGW